MIKNQLILKKVEQLDKSNTFTFIDTSYFLPHENRNVNIKVKNSIISTEGLFLDIDIIANKHSTYKHMFPKKDVFQAFCHENHIGYQQNIVFYDHKGIFSSARGYFTFLAYGFDNISILDGGFPAFERFFLLDESHTPSNPVFKFRQQETNTTIKEPCDIFIDSQFIIENMKNPNVKIIDARSNERFDGTQPEPRAELLSGHIPSSINLPFTSLLDSESCYRSKNEIQAMFNSLNIAPHHTLIFTCGSGITACIVAFAALLIGFDLDKIKIYDASWCEWGNGDFPVARKD